MTPKTSTPAAQGTVDSRRTEQLRIQQLGSGISRRDWYWTEKAYEAIRDEFDRRPVASPPAPTEALPASGVEAVLPCDVAVAPCTIIRKGCKVSTLLLAIERREGREIGGLSDAALAALSPTEAPAPAPSGMVRVKALVWEKDGTNLFAFGGFGQGYRIYGAPDHVWRVMFSWSTSLWDLQLKSLDEAKAAAQADYEAHILSALASDASPSGESDPLRYCPNCRALQPSIHAEGARHDG